MIFHTNSTQGSHRYLAAGFGLIELMVSVGIMVLVTGIVLARSDSFNGSTLVRSQAYEIALRIREMQLSAVSVTGTATQFRTSYGARFRTTNTGAANTNYELFSVDNLDAGWISDRVLIGPLGVLDQRFSITYITLNTPNAATPFTSVGEVNIVFKRPNFDAIFYNFGGATTFGSVNPADIESVSIYVGPRGAIGATRSAGNERKITIGRTGQIAVE